MNKRLFNIITDNWPAKVISIAMAVFLFLFQRMNSMFELRLDIPLEVRQNSTFTLVEPLPEKVHLNVSLPQEDAASVDTNNFSASVDLSPFEKTGKYIVPVQVQNSGGAVDIDMLDVDVVPREFAVILDKRSAKYIPVKPVFKGKAAPGFEISNESVTPHLVYVEGPSSVVDKLTSLSIKPVNITNADKNIQVQAELDNSNKSLSISGKNFQFSADVKPVVVSNEWNDIVIETQNLGEHLAISDEDALPKGSLTLSGAENDISVLELPDGALYADCSDIDKAGDYKLPVEVKAPQGFNVVSFEPKTVDIKVEKKK